MRWLKIAYTLSRAGRPVLLSATLLGGCGTRGLPVGDGGRLDARPVTDTLVAVEQDARVIVIPVPTYDADLKADVRQVPSPGVDGSGMPPSECIDIDAGADAGVSFAGGQAARVTLEWAPGGSGTVIGRIAVAPEIAGQVIGLPTVDMVGKYPNSGGSGDAPDAAISNLRRESGAFVFDVTWVGRDPASMCMGGVQAEWTFRTTLRLQCGGQERAIESLTTVAQCADYTWASSGDTCEKCSAICEMAPSPLPAAPAGDDLPLGSALTVVVRPLVRVGGAVVLWAEHAPRAGLRYAWQATAGALEELAPDLVLWRPPADPAPALAQVAVTGEDLAAVGSYRWALRAA